MNKSVLIEAADLLQEAIDLPYSNDPAAWAAWCDQWRPRAEASIKALSDLAVATQ